MSDEDHQQPNIQAGVPLTPGHDPLAEPVATGSRRQDMHYEPDPDQLLVAKSMVHPDGPMPPQEQSKASDTRETPPQPHIGDVRVDPATSSVWDARPVEDPEPRSGNPTGH